MIAFKIIGDKVATGKFINFFRGFHGNGLFADHLLHRHFS